MLLILASFSCIKVNKKDFDITQMEGGVDNLLIGLHVLDENVVWASGTESTIIRSVDGGKRWKSFQYQEVDTLQFRDIHAFNSDEIATLSIGEGSTSQIFKFNVGGEWKKVYQMEHPQGFLDALDFWDAKRGVAYGDAIDQKPFILKTEDGGDNWHRIEGQLLPDAGNGEGGFAASGTCIELGQKGEVWIGTGAGGHARILFSPDYGLTWKSYETPMIKGPAAGITSVRFDGHVGFITGGDLMVTDSLTNNMFMSYDHGKNWEPIGPPVTLGAFYGSAFIQDLAIIICGPNGSDLSFDNGKNWINISQHDLWTVDLHKSGIGYLMGRNGTILKINISG